MGFCLLLPAIPARAEKDVNELLSEARQQLEEYWDAEAALTPARKAVERAPKNARARVLLGRALLETDEPDKAIAQFGEAIRLDDKPVEALRYRSKAYDQQWKMRKAFADIHRAIVLQPTDYELYMERFWLWTDINAPAEALADAERAWQLARDPARGPAPADRAELQVDLAGAYAWAGQLERAEQILDKIRVPRDAPWIGEYILSCKADIECTRGRPEKAIALIDQAIRHARQMDDPGDSRYLFSYRGVYKAQQGRYLAAAADYTVALLGEPGDPYFLADRATAYFQAGKDDKALADFARALQEGPELAYVHYLVGDMHYLRDRYDKAAAAYRRVGCRQWGDLLVRQYFAARRAGEPKARERLAEEYADLIDKSLVRSQCAGYLLGKVPREKLLAAVEALPKVLQPNVWSEVCWTIGTEALVDGKTAEAAEWLAKASRAGTEDLNTRHFARAELARIQKDGDN